VLVHRIGLQMRSLRVTVVLALALLAPVASAQNNKAEAKAAYDRGVEAHKKGNFELAAQEFARADSLAPSPVALQAALDAAVDADDPALMGELIERSQRAPATGALRASVDAAKKKVAGRAGRVAIQCPVGSTCMATLDGAPFDTKRPAWARVGQHTVVVQVDGDAQTKLVDVKPDTTVDVAATSRKEPTPAPVPAPVAPAVEPRPAPPPVAPPPPRAEEPAGPTKSDDVLRNGLPPVVFWAGVGATVLLGGATTFFALDAKSKHGAFVDAGCDKAPEVGCDKKKKDGEDAQRFANIGFAATALAGVGTVVLGIAFTDWSGRGSKSAGATQARPIAAPIAGGAIGGLSGRF
jgi:hypothetical protein